MHATEYLRKPVDPEGSCLVVLYGAERHLKLESLGAVCRAYLGEPPESALGLARYSGPTLEFRELRDELHMVSMFSDRKLVLVEDAESFVTDHRALLEDYAERPARRSLLMLDVATWRSNTRLAKKVAQDGLPIECSELTGGALLAWLRQQAKSEHAKTLAGPGASLLVELAGSGLGQLNQELAKLAAYVGDRKEITDEDVRALVGGWKAETTWVMVDAIRDGKPGVALQCLAKLLYAGEPAPKILGGVNYVFRKYATAIEDSRQGTPLRQALQSAGFRPTELQAAEQYLRRIKRPRAERILEYLALADFGFKGGGNLPDTIVMEQLVLQLTGVLDVPEPV